jgi:hypothetical protein
MEPDLNYFRNFGEQVEQRLNKLDNFAQRNQPAYPARVVRNHTAVAAIKMYKEAEAALPEGSEAKPQLSVEVALPTLKTEPVAYKFISAKTIWGRSFMIPSKRISTWVTLWLCKVTSSVLAPAR